ncbi:MAG: sugar-transfer associated ATP-grasp domain-containing protein [Sphingomicrobium sp.]
MTSSPLLMQAAVRGERLVYRIAGLPVAVRQLFDRRRSASADVIRAAYALSYWQGGFDNVAEIAVAVLVAPLGVLIASVWLTARNGALVHRRGDKGLMRQFADQIRLYFTAGVLPPWYYIFHLHGGQEQAGAYLQRSETKAGIYPLLRRGVRTELNDKKLFADFCAENGVRCIPYLLYLDGSKTPDPLPDCDLFVKPASGRGGRGAERWDHVGPHRFVGADGEQVDSDQLAKHLRERSERCAILVQQRIEPHSRLAELTSGALPTVRVMTCLNELGHPEIVGGVFRMAIGGNRTVDNLHAGGIAANVRLEDGVLSSASDLGMDAKLGWLDFHPDTHARIEGRSLPLWNETKMLAVQAHRAFADRVLVGWDIAITDDGPVIVEGNSSPDLDILQRFGAPVCNSRFGDLLAWHLLERGFARRKPAGPVKGADVCPQAVRRG